MLRKKGKKVINISTIEHDDLIKMIESMEGVSVRKTVNGVQISIHKQALENSPVGICVRKKNKKEAGNKNGYKIILYRRRNRIPIYISPREWGRQYIL